MNDRLVELNTLNNHLGEVIERYIDAVKVNKDEFQHIYLDDILQEYVQKNKSDYENFMNPQILDRYIDSNQKNSLYVAKMGKRIWRPDKFKLGRDVRPNFEN